jgi:phosphatidylglycerophosphate synthase
VTSPETIFITADPGSPAPHLVVGGLTVLERRLIEADRAGARRAIVAVDGELPDRAFGLAIERAEPGSEPPAGAELVRADELAGVAIASKRDARRAEWALLTSLPKSFQGPVDALINCHVSLRITRILAKTPITPNIVTVVALLIGLGAAGLLAYGVTWAVAVAGVLMELQSIVDSCDGELARLRFQFSKLGQWLDNVADDITDSALMLGLGLAAGGRLWLWIGAAAAAARVFTQLVLYWQVKRAGGDFWNFRWWFESDVDSLDDVYDLRSPLVWFRSLGRRDVYLFLWGVLCVVGQVPIAAGYAAAMAALFTAMTLIHLVVTAGRRS